MDLREIIERLNAKAHVKTVYGDPVQMGGRTIIPVAKVRYGFFVGRLRQGESWRGDEGEGMNSGGVIIRPTGVVEVTPEHTRFIPNLSPLIVAAAVGAGLLAGLLLRGGGSED